MAPSVKSTSLTRLHGTARRDRRRPKLNASARLVMPPRPPRHLSKGAEVEWKRIARTLVELRAITAADLFLVELLASTMATVRTAEVTLEAEGSCATGTAANGLKGHPAARVLATARAQAARLLGELGLTPRGRAMLDLHPAALPELVDDDDGQPGMSLDQYLASNPDLRPAARRR